MKTVPLPSVSIQQPQTESLSVVEEASLLPTLISNAGPRTTKHFLEFFTVTIRNPHTRRAYARACVEFLNWCDQFKLQELSEIEPMMVAAYIERKGSVVSPQTVKQNLAAVRKLFDWLVIQQDVPFNPASVVRGPRYSVTEGKTPVLSTEETRMLLESLDTTSVVGLRDRALLAVMLYSFARVSAVVSMNVEDYFQSGKRSYLRLAEKGGKDRKIPVHHKAEEFLDAYLEVAGIGGEKGTPLFRSTRGRSGTLSDRELSSTDVYRMVRRRAKKLEDLTENIGCHSFRATGITNLLENGGNIEQAQEIAGHSDVRTTRLYDRRKDRIALEIIERIRF